jgi:hypothetical protein
MSYTPGSLYAFSLVSSLCVLFGLNFLFRKGKLVVAKVLAIQFLLLGYLVVAAYFLLPENIIQTPYFFRTLAPLFYALPPLNFLFMWYLFHPRAKFKRIHLLFFIPLAVQLIENTPFYLSSKQTKIEEIKWMLAQGDYFAFSERFMWFDPVYHVYAKFAIDFLPGYGILLHSFSSRQGKSDFVPKRDFSLLDYWCFVISNFHLVLHLAYLHLHGQWKDLFFAGGLFVDRGICFSLVLPGCESQIVGCQNFSRAVERSRAAAQNGARANSIRERGRALNGLSG